MVTRADIEAKARELEAAIAETKEAAKDATMLLAVGVVVVVAAAFFLGRRKGKKAKAVVEVYRV